jgi:hypothetical protein
MSYDVVVAGGGISGGMAAVAASRCGAGTLVVEQYGFLGGMLTAAGVGPMMTFHAGDRQVIQGLTGELVDRLSRKGKSPGHIFDTTGYTYSVTPFDAESMKHELEMMLLESGGDVLYHTMLAEVRVEAGRILGITVCNKSGLHELKGKIFIDATGDADLSAWAGVEFSKGRASDGACQPMTMNLKMRNVDIDAVKKFIRDNPEEFPRLQGDTGIVDRAPRLSIGGFVRTLQEAQRSGEISFKREDVLFFETNIPGEVIVNTTRVLGCDGTDPWSLTKAEIEGRRQVRELEKFLREKISGFQRAETVYSGPAIGVRSSRQIKGLYTLTGGDLLSCEKFGDVIAQAGYPVDIHSPDGEGTNHMHLKWGDIYSIPYRCLVNDKIGNLITVGRCISATFEAQAAIRTTPTAGAIGHAGGVAAALAAKRGVKASDVDMAELQRVLKDQGAYL